MGLDEYHDRIESEFNRLMVASGFHESIDLAYHHVRDLEKKCKNTGRADAFERLQEVYTPTSIVTRTRADRVSVHTSFPIVVKWDVKTSLRTGPDRDVSIEAVPLLQAAHEYENYRTMYLFVCAINGAEYVFAAGKSIFSWIPPAVYYRSCELARMETLKEPITRLMKGLGINRVHFFDKNVRAGKSGDPFFEVPVQTKNLPGMEEAIKTTLEFYI